MEVCKLIFKAILLSIFVLGSEAYSTTQLPNFTDDEKRYLEAKIMLRLCIDPNWMPYEKISDRGRHFGITADYFDLFQQRLGIPIVLFPTSTWDETLEAVRTRKCDLISAAKRTEQREKYLDFTSPYLHFPLAVAVRDTETPDADFTNEMHKTYAIQKGYAAIENLPKAFPKIQIITVIDRYEGFEMVKQGKAYGFIDSWPIIAYGLKTEGIIGLKIGGELPAYGGLGAATRNDEPELLGIFEKLTKSLLPRDFERINKKWLAVDVQKEFDFQILALILSVVLILTAFFVYLIWRLIEANKKAHLALQQLTVAQIELTKIASTDKLTGLYNRNKIDELILNEISRSARYQHTFGVIMVDIDYFKSINDNHGHHVGDKVLKEYASIIKNCIRETDYAGRWGGDEFIVICPETDVDGLHKLAEKICNKVASHEFRKTEKSSASLGFTTPKQGDTLASILQRVDKALYHAKSEGRNRVVFSESAEMGS